MSKFTYLWQVLKAWWGGNYIYFKMRNGASGAIVSIHVNNPTPDDTAHMKEFAAALQERGYTRMQAKGMD